MKNLTVSLNDDIHHQTRINAANAGLSMSRYIASLVEKDAAEKPDEEAERARRLEMLERFLNGPKISISEHGRMPTAEERNDRR